MRDFSAERNVLEIQDGISGDTHEIYTRMPTNQELAAYQNGFFERSGRKLKTRIHENRQKYGLRVITGFKKGTLAFNGKPISTDQADPDYREDWKDLLAEYAPDIVGIVAAAVFEGTGIARGAEIESPLDE